MCRWSRVEEQNCSDEEPGAVKGVVSPSSSPEAGSPAEDRYQISAGVEEGEEEEREDNVERREVVYLSFPGSEAARAHTHTRTHTHTQRRTKSHTHSRRGFKDKKGQPSTTNK